jgi:hypothetical protein
VYGLAVHAFARRWLPSGWALVGTLLVLLNLQLLWLSDALFAELPFACATMLFFLVGERGDRRGLTALLGAAAYLLRASGLALLVAWVVEALLERRILEAALRASLAALPVLVWQSYVNEVQTSAEFTAPAYAYQRAAYQFYNVGYAANVSYVDPFVPERGLASTGDVLRRVVANVAALPPGLGESISIRAEGPLGEVFRLHALEEPMSASVSVSRIGFALIGIVATAGLMLLVADGMLLVPLYWMAALSLIVLAPWPSQLGRYLMPLAPITTVGLLFVFAHAEQMASRLVQIVVHAAIGILLAVELVVLGMIFTTRYQPVAPTQPGAPQRLFFYGSRWQQHDAALAWLAATARRDAVVATTTPHRLHLASGLRAILPPFVADPEEAARLVDGVPVEYLVIDALDFLDVARRYGEPIVAAHPERWRLVYAGPGGGPDRVRIYHRVAAR